MQFIDLARQRERIGPEVRRRMDAVLEHGQFILGPEVAELESRLAAYTGAAHCVGVSDGTTALLIALMALDVGQGDEVITTPFSFIATTEVIALLGAKPVFVDIDPRTYTLDAAKLAAAITPRTRAIMPVSLYGQCADMDAVNAIAGTIPVIEDAAQSFGAAYRGRMSCALSTIGCTSFFPSKPLGCYGDGGACFTNDPKLATRMRQIRAHGQEARYVHTRIGLNGRLDTLQAAVLLAKLDVFVDEVNARARIGAAYSEALAPYARTPFVEAHNTSVFAQYTLEVAERASFTKALAEAGIPTAVHYPSPLHLQPAFAYLGLGAGAFPVAERASGRVVSLPMHPYLTEEEIARVVAAVRGQCSTHG